MRDDLRTRDDDGVCEYAYCASSQIRRFYVFVPVFCVIVCCCCCCCMKMRACGTVIGSLTARTFETAQRLAKYQRTRVFTSNACFKYLCYVHARVLSIGLDSPMLLFGVRPKAAKPTRRQRMPWCKRGRCTLGYYGLCLPYFFSRIFCVVCCVSFITPGFTWRHNTRNA